jgi:hypothetical protein
MFNLTWSLRSPVNIIDIRSLEIFELICWEHFECLHALKNFGLRTVQVVKWPGIFRKAKFGGDIWRFKTIYQVLASNRKFTNKHNVGMTPDIKRIKFTNIKKWKSIKTILNSKGEEKTKQENLIINLNLNYKVSYLFSPFLLNCLKFEEIEGGRLWRAAKYW